MIDLVRAGEMVVSAETFPLLKEAGLNSFDAFMEFTGGTRICHKRGRSVFRFEIGGRAFYLKRNRLHPVEFWKAVSNLRWPRLGARIEWENILALHRFGIPTVTPVAIGERFGWGVETSSFTLTEEIYDAEPLDVVLRREFSGSLPAGKLREKRQLIRKIAALAATFHDSGMNHQDFYLNHFFQDRDGTLYLLDLQRVGRRRKIPRRCRVKDLAQLMYSTEVYGVGSRTDRMRFFLAYLGLTVLGSGDKDLARCVLAKARRIARHDVKLMARRRRRGELPCE